MKIKGLVAVAAAMALAAGPAVAAVTVQEGTEFPVRLEETLSSKTAKEGDRFTIALDDDVKLPDGTVIKAGYRGVGEIVNAEPSGALGKTGKINVRLTYLKVGDQRIRLRASKGAEGKHNTTAQVVGVVFIGVFAGFIKGKNTTIPKGTMITAFADQDSVLETPLAPPPPEV